MSKSIVAANPQKQQTHLRLHFLDFAMANLFMILIVCISRRRVYVPISHKHSCSIPGVTKLFSLRAGLLRD